MAIDNPMSSFFFRIPFCLCYFFLCVPFSGLDFVLEEYEVLNEEVEEI